MILLGADEFVLWARPAVRVEVAGASCREAESAYKREALLDLYFPLLDTLALRSVRPDEAEEIVARGLETICPSVGGDSADDLRRARGHHGLDVLHRLQEELGDLVARHRRGRRGCAGRR